MNRFSSKKKLSNLFIYIILTITAIVVLYPVVWIITGSLNPGDSLFSTRLIPETFSFHHYTYLFEQTNYLVWYKNTLKIAFWNMIISTY